MIPLDFVPGTHGHFLESVLNRAFGFTQEEFVLHDHLGTSHRKPQNYLRHRQISCNHYYQVDREILQTSDRVIRIVFDQDDLLLVSSLSLLRAADLGIDNNYLHLHTKSKLNNKFYAHILNDLYKAYGNQYQDMESIPRNILREYFKFGFKDPGINGYWKELQKLLEVPVKNDFRISLQKIYQVEELHKVLLDLADWLNLSLHPVSWLQFLHKEFLDKIPYLEHGSQCEQIIAQIISNQDVDIENLSLLQESYINARLENIFEKEMPFHPVEYFKNTKDVLNYIKLQAPNL